MMGDTLEFSLNFALEKQSGKLKIVYKNQIFSS